MVRLKKRSTIIRAEHEPIKQAQDSKKPVDPFWTSPWTRLGLSITIIAIAILIFKDWQTKRLIIFLSLDSSASALENPAEGENICRNTVGRLISGDTLFTLPYADTTEVQNSTKISSPNSIFKYCDQYRNKEIPKSLGKFNGTSPLALLDRVLDNIKIERKQGNSQSIVLISYLQDAEPGPNVPPLNFDKLAERLRSIQKERGTVLLIGTSGDLRKQLEVMNSKYSDLKELRLCSSVELMCIREAFDSAR